MFYFMITEEGENIKNLEQNDAIEINYLKKFFVKSVVAPHDVDSSLISNPNKVTASVDLRCRYTITDMSATTRDYFRISHEKFLEVFITLRNY